MLRDVAEVSADGWPIFAIFDTPSRPQIMAVFTLPRETLNIEQSTASRHALAPWIF